MIKAFIARPAIVKAVQYKQDRESRAALIELLPDSVLDFDQGGPVIRALEGNWIGVYDGDWVVHSPAGPFRMTDKAFRKNYIEVQDF